MRPRNPLKAALSLAGVASAVLASLAMTARAEDWPQWRGPSMNGSSPDTGLPENWSRTENVVWVTPLPGPSAATPAVWGDRVFVSSMDALTGWTLAVCIDRKDGRVIKRCGIAAGGRKLDYGNTNSSPSPVTDGRRAYFLYGTGDLVAVDFDGNVVWRRNLQTEYGES